MRDIGLRFGCDHSDLSGFLSVFGFLCGPLGFVRFRLVGFVWADSLGFVGIRWDSLGFVGILWDSVEFVGIGWDSLGFVGTRKWMYGVRLSSADGAFFSGSLYAEPFLAVRTNSGLPDRVLAASEPNRIPAAKPTEGRRVSVCISELRY